MKFCQIIGTVLYFIEDCIKPENESNCNDEYVESKGGKFRWIFAYDTMCVN